MTNDGKFTLTLVRGDDTTIVIDFVDEDDNPIDLTGRTYSSQIRLKPSQTGAPDAEFTCTVTDIGGGELTLFLASADLDTLTETCYWADLQETLDGLVTTILLPGKVTIVQDVTHA